MMMRKGKLALIGVRIFLKTPSFSFFDLYLIETLLFQNPEERVCDREPNQIVQRDLSSYYDSIR